MGTRKANRNKKTKSRHSSRSKRRSRGGGASALVSNPPAAPPAYPVYKPGPGQFGYQDPNQVSLTGSHTRYEIGVPGFGLRGYTKIGAPLSTMQHVGVTGYPQTAALAAGLLIPGAAATMSGAPQGPSTFDPKQAPPNYYAALGMIRPDTPIDNTLLDTAYMSKKNVGTNADKKLVKTAYNTLSDPAKRYQYDAAVNQYYTMHPPSLSQLAQMAPPMPLKPGQKSPFPPGFNPLQTALTQLSWLPGLKSTFNAPIAIRR